MTQNVEHPVSDATGKLYARLAYRLEESGKDPVTWFNEQARDAEMSKKTLDIYRSTTANYMVWKGLAENKPGALSKLMGTSRGRGDRRKEALSQEEVEDFLSFLGQLKAPIPVFLKVLLCTGLRVAEGCALTADDIKITGRNPHLVVQKGKGNKPRTVELSSDGVTVLKSYLREHKKRGGCLFPWTYMKQVNDSFIREGVVEPLQPYVVRREMQALRKKEEQMPEATPHILRHTLASDMLQAGGSLKHIQKMLGHQGLDVLERYLTVRSEQMHDVLDKMPKRWAEE